MPWLISAALLHSTIVVEKREALKSWTILLAILAFGFSLLGTFIVRSGVLTSVHAFANDPERGVYIFGIMVFFTGGALVLYALRASALQSTGAFAVVSRESALVLNNLLLAVATFVVFIGTIWPLIAELVMGRVLSVGPPFFNAAFTPFMMALAVALPLGSILAWKRGALARVSRGLIGWAVLAVAIGALCYAVQSGRSALGPLGVALGVWVIGGAIADVAMRTGRGSWRARLGRLGRLPRADWGKATAHFGIGVTFIGIASMLAWEIEDIRAAEVGESYTVGSYQVTLGGVEQARGPNYVTSLATLEFERGGRSFTLTPEKRFYPVPEMPTTEADIQNGFLRDVYAVIGDPQEAGGFAVRIYIKPLANWIWGGAILMSLGGLISLTDRRLRVAGGARKDAQTVAAE